MRRKFCIFMVSARDAPAMNAEIVTYCTCMEEVNLRIGLVRSVVARSNTTGREDFDAELVFVRLRKTLEMIAFASLSANKAN
jgi:hypothetical protein